MKRFIILFFIFIITLGVVIGKCNSESEDYQTDDEIVLLADSQSDEKKVEIIKEEPSSVSDIKEEEQNEEKLPDKEIPVITPSSLPVQILVRKAFILSYNKLTKCPNWVAWHLTSDHINGPIGRSNAFYEDEEVPAPRATNEDYKGSGWSRGHMCPAGDNKWDEEAMNQSFCLTNVCPQDASLNSGLWNSIEIDCRNWAKRFQDIYIICGPVFYKQEHELIGINKVCVPEAFFKVVLCLNGKPKGMGFVVKNNAGTKKKDLYFNSIDQVERITGLDFFPALPDSIENAVEAHANIDDWK